jgi:outer membrane lipoprotein carrier protein
LFGDVRNALITSVILAVAATKLLGAPAAGQTLDKVLDEVQQRQESTRTIQAEFRQEKTMDLLAGSQVSTGSFAYSKPDKVRWDYTSPSPVVMLIAGGRLTNWYPALKKAETLEVTRFQDRIFRYMGAGSAIDELSSYFNFRFTEKQDAKVYRLDLAPKTRQIEKRVRTITIWIDKETYLTSRIEFVEGDGDTTLYEFSNIRINEPIDALRFELDLPGDVRVDQIRLD